MQVRGAQLPHSAGRGFVAGCLPRPGPGGGYGQSQPGPLPSASVGLSERPELLQPLGPTASWRNHPTPGFPHLYSKLLRVELREQEASFVGQVGLQKGDCSQGKRRPLAGRDSHLFSGNPKKWQLSQAHYRWDMLSF